MVLILIVAMLLSFDANVNVEIRLGIQFKIKNESFEFDGIFLQFRKRKLYHINKNLIWFHEIFF